MKSIDEDIKNSSFQRVYLLYGEESYLKRQYKQKLKQALSSPGDTLNAAYYEIQNEINKSVPLRHAFSIIFIGIIIACNLFQPLGSDGLKHRLVGGF